jgi:hypothetical protein
MPFKSRAQVGKFFEMEKRGEIPKGTALRWAHDTPSIKRLPKRVSQRKPAARGGSRRSR